MGVKRASVLFLHSWTPIYLSKENKGSQRGLMEADGMSNASERITSKSKNTAWQVSWVIQDMLWSHEMSNRSTEWALSQFHSAWLFPLSIFRCQALNHDVTYVTNWQLIMTKVGAQYKLYLFIVLNICIRISAWSGWKQKIMFLFMCTGLLL